MHAEALVRTGVRWSTKLGVGGSETREKAIAEADLEPNWHQRMTLQTQMRR